MYYISFIEYPCSHPCMQPIIFFSFGWPRHTSKVMHGSSVAMKWRMVLGRVTVLSSSLGCEGKLSDDLRL